MIQPRETKYKRIESYLHTQRLRGKSPNYTEQVFHASQRQNLAKSLKHARSLTTIGELYNGSRQRNCAYLGEPKKK
jgi:hypothetical protein